jgi:hypothetical protein
VAQKERLAMWPSRSPWKSRFGRLIRAATSADAGAVARVQLASWRAAYAHLFSAGQYAKKL